MYPTKDQFTSENKKHYKSYDRFEKAKPHRDKNDLVATHFVLGDDNLDFKTTSKI